MDNLLPEQLEKQYRLIKPLGMGGFGAVYLVEDKKYNRKSALKILKAELANREVLQRFRMEYLGLKKYGTTYSAEVFDFLEMSGKNNFYGILMEYLPYGLIEWIEKNPADLKRINFEIIKALYSFHSNTIAHRDLKPENIRIRSNGQPALIDFGLAFWSEDSLTKLTQEEKPRFMGTILYMPPEILFLSPKYQHIPECNEASMRLKFLAEKYKDIRQRGIAQRLIHDVFSLGMILLLINDEESRRMLIDEPIKIAEQYILSPSSFIRQALSRLDGGLRNLIEKAVEIFPDQRIENAGVMLEFYMKTFPEFTTEPEGPVSILLSPIKEQRIFCVHCSKSVVVKRDEIRKIKYCPYCRAELYHRLTISSLEPVESGIKEFKTTSIGSVLEIPFHTSQKFLFKLGRSSNNDIIFKDRTVSRNHAQLEISQEKVVLKNENPKNATLVNDEVLGANKSFVLQGHDTIQLGYLSYLTYDLIFKKKESML